MKKIILSILITWITFCSASFAADNNKIFDWCWKISNYTKQTRYNSLKKQLTNQWISVSQNGNNWTYVSDICYSKSRNQIIINVPITKSNNKKCENNSSWTWLDYCIKNLNIFSYNIKTNKLAQASLDSNTIYTWFIKTTYESIKKDNELKYKFIMYIWNNELNIFQNPNISTTITQFWIRSWDYIKLSSSYGDAGCYSSNYFRYYYKTNTIKAESEERWCVEEWYSTITNFITKTTKKVKIK